MKATGSATTTRRSSSYVAAHGAVAIENAQAYRMLEGLDREVVAVPSAWRPTNSGRRVGATESLLTALAEGYVGDLRRPTWP